MELLADPLQAILVAFVCVPVGVLVPLALFLRYLGAPNGQHHHQNDRDERPDYV